MTLNPIPMQVILELYMPILLATEHNAKWKGKGLYHQDHSMISIKYDTEIKPVKVYLFNPISLQNNNNNLAHKYCCWSMLIEKAE